MSEREPHARLHRPPEAAGVAWDLPALATALDAAPEPVADLFFGEGTGFHVGPERTTHLALYPAHRAVELTTPDLVVSFRRPTAAHPLDGGVLFEIRSRRSRVSLTVGADGGASLLSDPLPTDPPSPGLLAELARLGIRRPPDPASDAPAHADDETRQPEGGRR